MTGDRTRPPQDADERTSLLGWLDLQRDIIRFKCEGLTDDAARRVVVPTSPLMTVAGVVSHLRWTEHCWFQVILRGREEELNPQFGDDDVPDDLDWADPRPLADLLADYRRECAASNAAVAAMSFDDTAVHPMSGASLRWILHHMLEETARHAGQLDLLTELLDGRKGYW
jgi:uncharacterized damage-inducible protein DinB